MSSNNGPMSSKLEVESSNTPSSPLSPLSPLRLSRNRFDTRPNKEQKKDTSENAEDTRERKESLRLDPLEESLILSPVNHDDFGFEVPLDDVIQNDQHRNNQAHVWDKSQLKKAGELTSIFLDTRKNLRVDCNIVDPINTTTEGTGDLWQANDRETNGNVRRISRNTIIRAEKVKSMIGLKYLFLQKLYDWSVFNSRSNIHEGVEGVYNPLQILRNRKIRAKYGEYPRSMTVKTLPLASNVFSKKYDPKNPKQSKKIIWAIELNELLSDATWRQLHWNELRRPDGRLWFPESGHDSVDDSKQNEVVNNEQRALHDKLFDEEANEDISRTASYDKRQTSYSSTASTVDDGAHKHIFKLSKTPHKRHKIKEKIKKHTKTFYYSSSSSSQSSFNGKEAPQDEGNAPVGEKPVRKSRDSLTLGAMPSVRESENIFDNSEKTRDETHIEYVEDRNGNEQNLQIPNAPKIKIDGNDIEFNTISLPFKSIENNRNISSEESKKSEIVDESNEANMGDVEETNEIENKLQKQEAQEQEMNNINYHLNYFNTSLAVKLNYVIKVYPVLMESLDFKLNNIIDRQLLDVTKLTINIDENYISAYESLYMGFLNEIRSLVHLINDDYSIKIDNLLSNSDRSIGEINTSLNLELRKINEKLDKLNSSLFGNIVTDTLKDNDLAINFKDGGNYKILYTCLENFIVILLKLVWVIATIYRSIRMVLRIIWKVIWHILNFLFKF